MEFQSDNLTPDGAAVLRAERLLLNKNLPAPTTHYMGDMMQEIMIKGQQVEVEVSRSPSRNFSNSLLTGHHFSWRPLG